MALPSRTEYSSDTVVDLTRALVSADSQNLPGNERGAADIARQLLEPLGATFVEVEPVVNRTSLLATLNDHDPSRPTIIVNGHLDVVPVSLNNWTKDPFNAEFDPATQKLFGRGTTDMKGGIAAAIEAVQLLRRSSTPIACNVVFHLVADEERGGGFGTAVLAREGLIQGHACLIPEPTNLNICVAERGALFANITVHGKPAHGSQPANGVSATAIAARITTALHGVDFDGAKHELLGNTTCNVGTLQGGSSVNIVADRCVIGIDRRLNPGDTRESIFTEIHQRIAALNIPNLNYDFDVIMLGEPSELDQKHELVALMHNALQNAGQSNIENIGMSFTTDARFVRNNARIPAIVCGPGAIEQAHTDDEYVEVASLVAAVHTYANLFATFNTAYSPLT